MTKVRLRPSVSSVRHGPSRLVRRADPQAVAAQLLALCPLRPRLGLILGSGFAHVTDQIQVAAEVPFRQLPGFVEPRVPGHEGRMLIGQLGPARVVALSGRLHFYEGYPMQVVTFPVRVLAALGVRTLLLTNAAGGINPRLRPGDFMRVTDHINLMGVNPLCGPAEAGLTRFVDLTQAYDPGLGRLLSLAARRARVRLRTGVYVAVSGPSYETPAEIRAFARLGADAVGMSTVPEVIVARQCGLAVAAVCCITNLAAGRSRQPLSHQEVLDTSRRVAASATGLLTEFARLYAQLYADA